MKKLVVMLACLGLIIFPTIIMANVITFDDIVVPGDRISDAYAFAPGSYSGVAFDESFLLMHDWRYTNSTERDLLYGNTYGSPSGDFAVFNASGNNDLEVTFDTASIFGGASFSAFTEYDTIGVGSAITSAQSITVYGYLNGDYVNEVSMDLGVGYETLAANMIVDRLVFRYTPIEGQQLGWWLMDDFDPDTVPNGQVPEPATLLLIGAGLLGIGLARRKFK